LKYEKKPLVYQFNNNPLNIHMFQNIRNGQSTL